MFDKTFSWPTLRTDFAEIWLTIDHTLGHKSTKLQQSRSTDSQEKVHLTQLLKAKYGQKPKFNRPPLMNSQLLTFLPSDMERHVTASLCPERVPVHVPNSTDHTLMVWSVEPERRQSPSQKRQSTRSPWPRSTLMQRCYDSGLGSGSGVGFSAFWQFRIRIRIQ